MGCVIDRVRPVRSSKIGTGKPLTSFAGQPSHNQSVAGAAILRLRHRFCRCRGVSGRKGCLVGADTAAGLATRTIHPVFRLLAIHLADMLVLDASAFLALVRFLEDIRVSRDLHVNATAALLGVVLFAFHRSSLLIGGAD